MDEKDEKGIECICGMNYCYRDLRHQNHYPLTCKQYNSWEKILSENEEFNKESKNLKNFDFFTLLNPV